MSDPRDPRELIEAYRQHYLWIEGHDAFRAVQCRCGRVWPCPVLQKIVGGERG